MFQEAMGFLISLGLGYSLSRSIPTTPHHPILVAAIDGNTEKLTQYLDQGTDIELEDVAGYTRDKSRPLHYAAKFGHVEAVRLLLDRHAMINVPNDANHWTPLHLAAQRGHLEVVRLLIERGALIDPVDWNGGTPLCAAASDKHQAIVKFLIENGADIEKLKKTMFGEKAFNYIKDLATQNKITVANLHLEWEDKRFAHRYIAPTPTFSTPEEFAQALRIARYPQLTVLPQQIDPYHGAAYAESLLDVLREDKKITHISMNDCNINNRGIIALGQLLEHNSYITHLNLERNNITNEGLTSFCNSLKKNKTLVSLNLHYNCIFDRGAQALAEVIKIHPTLIHIDVSSNPIGEDGALAIIHAIQHKKEKKGTVNLSHLSMNKENNMWRHVTIRIWEPKKTGEFGHVTLQTHTKENSIYASLWPPAGANGESSKPEQLTELYKLIVQGGPARYIETYRDEKLHGMRTEPDHTIDIPNLDIIGINKSYHEFKNSNQILWRLLGEIASEKLEQNCCSFVLYLLRSGSNHGIIDPLCRELGVAGIDVISPEKIKQLSIKLRELQHQRFRAEIYDVGFPYRDPSIPNYFRPPGLTQTVEGENPRRNAHAGAQRNEFFVNPLEREINEPPPRSTLPCIIL